MEEQQEFRAVHLHVTEGAQSEQFGDLPVLYVGVSYHIPKAHIQEAQRILDETQDLERAQTAILKDEMGPDELLAQVRAQGFEPLPNALLERFDTVDSNSGDMLVLLRVPCLIGMPGMFAQD